MEALAKELRIGNFINFNGNLNEGEIKTVQPVDIFVINENPDLVTPIPLTEEWLVKFGFEKGIDTFGELEYLIEVTNKGVINEMVISKTFEVYMGCWSKTLNHVHSLQNLYFALTGEELTIKNNNK